MKQLFLIKWKSDYLILKLDKIFKFRRQGSNVETGVLWFFVVSLFVQIKVKVGGGGLLTEKITRKRLHSDSKFFFNVKNQKI